MNNNKILSMISLAKKAGKVVSGEFSVDTAGKSGSAQLVILAEDASQRTIKSVTDMCAFYKVPYVIFGTKESLGRAIGKENRAQIAVTDPGFAQAIQKLMVPAQEIMSTEERQAI